MKVEVNGNIINIKSPIITISDVEQIIDILHSKENEAKIILNINSFSLPSSIIGELIKLTDKNVDIAINVKDETLYELLEALKLKQKFKIRKV